MRWAVAPVALAVGLSWLLAVTAGSASAADGSRSVQVQVRLSVQVGLPAAIAAHLPHSPSTEPPRRIVAPPLPSTSPRVTPNDAGHGSLIANGVFAAIVATAFVWAGGKIRGLVRR